MENSVLIQPSSVILASGGARGITARCVIRLAEVFHCKFILVGRSTLDRPEPDWAAGCTDHGELKKRILNDLQSREEKVSPMAVQKIFSLIQSRREIETTLDSIRNAGGEAIYLSVDIADPQALKPLLDDAVRQLGPVTGLIHGAGSLADKLIEKKSAIDFEMVYSPKIKGLKSLLTCIPPEQLDFLVLFSSVVALYGNPGQADYAIANQILDHTARLIQARHPKCRVLTINWGPWEGGMVTPELKKFFAAHHVDLIPIDAGAQTLLNLLSAKQAQDVQVVVGNTPMAAQRNAGSKLEKTEIHRKLSLAANPFAMDHVIGENPVLPATCAAAWIIHGCEQRYPGYRFDRLDEYRVLKGIVFDESIAESYTLLLEETTKTNAEIGFNARIYSRNAAGKVFYHYSSRVRLVSQSASDDTQIEPTPVPYLPGDGIPGSTLYQDGTLFHGPVFQGIQEVYHVDEDGLAMRCRLSKLPESIQGQFPAQTSNPFLNDSIVQCLLIWSQKYYQAPCLPSHLEVYQQMHPVLFDKDYYIRLSVRSHSSTSVVGNIRVQDQSGLDVMQITGLEGTVSQLLKRFIGAKA